MRTKEIEVSLRPLRRTHIAAEAATNATRHRTVNQPATADRYCRIDSEENNWFRMPSGSAILGFCWTATSVETTD